MTKGDLKSRLAADVKAAMLARDAFLCDTLKGLKAVILNEEIAQKKRDVGLSNTEIETIFVREVKKRQEAAELYDKGGNQEMADKERREKSVIEQYLPEQLSEADIQKLIEDAVMTTSASGMQDMGKVIGVVKAKTGNTADGSIIAKLVKTRLQ
jgi:uncharacterized protein YqeY